MATKLKTYYVEGPNWENEVQIDPAQYDGDERMLMLEIATLGIEKQLGDTGEEGEVSFDVGPLLIVREKTKSKKKPVKEAFVNSYICLLNCGQYKIGEALRENYKKASGQDLRLDENGVSF